MSYNLDICKIVCHCYRQTPYTATGMIPLTQQFASICVLQLLCNATYNTSNMKPVIIVGRMTSLPSHVNKGPWWNAIHINESSKMNVSPKIETELHILAIPQSLYTSFVYVNLFCMCTDCQRFYNFFLFINYGKLMLQVHVSLLTYLQTA